MERAATESSLPQDGAQWISQPGVPDNLPPPDLAVLRPKDVQREVSFVASQVAVRRRPPALALTLPTRTLAAQKADGQQPGQETERLIRAKSFSATVKIDLGVIAELEPEFLAWRVAEMSSRLSSRPDLAQRPEAENGLQILNLQALMFEHLQILTSAAAEGIA